MAFWRLQIVPALQCAQFGEQEAFPFQVLRIAPVQRRKILLEQAAHRIASGQPQVLPQMPAAQAGGSGFDLMVRAVAGVLRNAQDGELPLFAWTLGLPQPELSAMVARCFPELGTLEWLPQQQYAAIVAAAPGEFRDLAAMLLANRSATADLQHADWLAHAVAAASRLLRKACGLVHAADPGGGIVVHRFAPDRICHSQ
jgi:hypothetical protein